jgi:hypothetical protein
VKKKKKNLKTLAIPVAGEQTLQSESGRSESESFRIATIPGKPNFVDI